MDLERNCTVDGFTVERVDVFAVGRNLKRWVVSLTKLGEVRRWLNFPQPNYPTSEDIKNYYIEKYNDNKT